MMKALIHSFMHASLVNIISLSLVMLSITAAAAGFVLQNDIIAFVSLAFTMLLLSYYFPKQLLFLIVFSMPFSLEMLHSSKDLFQQFSGGINPNGLAATLLIVFALPVITVKAWRAGWRPPLSIALYAAFLTWAAMTVLYSDNPSTGLKYAGYMVYLLISLVLYQYLRHTGRISASTLIKWLLTGVTISALLGYIFHILNIDFLDIYRTAKIMGTEIKRFTNPFGYGAAHWGLSMALVTIVAAVTMPIRRRHKAFHIIALYSAILTLIITYTRIPFLVMSIYLLFWTAYQKKYLIWTLVLVGIFAVLILTPMGLRFHFFTFALKDYEKAEQVEQKSSKQEEEEVDEYYELTQLDEKRLFFQTALSGRGILLKAGIQLVTKAPVLGYGLGSAEQRLYLFLRHTWKVNVPIVTIHSEILRSIIDTGYIGAALLLLFLIRLFTEILKKLKQKSKFAMLGMMVFFYFLICLSIEPLFTLYRFGGSLFFLIFALVLSEGNEYVAKQKQLP